jgi:methyltransferase-like protein/cyclopropane fatty-acyl-phospholipid synthase-like methyltransferase
MGTSDPYDLVRYPTPTFPQTHPDRLATIGALVGMEPAPPERCRYLELGCGSGMNLIAMAAVLPESRFAGFDLAAEPIAEAEATARALGLTNVEFRRADILAPGELGKFDYVVAHGVFSWVPLPVREAMLKLCRDHLDEHGIGYISFNAYPGCHVREMARRMMRFHTREVAEPQGRIEQGRALMQFIADAKSWPEAYAPLLTAQLEHMRTADRSLIYHDDLSEVNQPYYFHEFVGMLAQHQLQYVAEAALHEMQDRTYPPAVVQALRSLDDDLLTKEQYLDFLKFRRFRQSLVCHARVALDRRGSPARVVRRLRFASDAGPAPSPPELTDPAAVTFRRANQSVVSTVSPLVTFAMGALGEAWPRTIAFGDLLARARRELASAEEDELGGALLELVGIGLVDARVSEVPCATSPGARPRASAIARYQAARGPVVATLNHCSVRMEDQLIRTLLSLLDGEHDHPALATALTDGIAGGRLPLPPGVATRDPAAVRRAVEDELPRLLQRTARLALLDA